MVVNQVIDFVKILNILMKVKVAPLIIFDYIMVSDSFYDEATSFVVKPQTEMSDHCEIIAWQDASDQFSNSLEPR